jgi:hypothetical protein
LNPALVLDARRAIWLAAERTLVVADLHVGYVWAQRQSGQLLPLSASDDTADRLFALAEDYDAQSIVLLGDIVHAAVSLPELWRGTRELVRAIACASFGDLCGRQSRSSARAAFPRMRYRPATGAGTSRWAVSIAARRWRGLNS